MERVTESQLAYLQEQARQSGMQTDWDKFNEAANEYNRQCLKEAQDYLRRMTSLAGLGGRL